MLSALFVGAGVAAAQEPVTPVPRVRLASPQTPPGGETFVTVMLTNVPGEAIQVLKTEIEFQANHLTYVTARPGFADDLAGATVEVTLQPVEATAPPLVAGAPPPKPGASPVPPARPRTRIALTVTGKKTIPNGPVAELRFRLGPAFKATPQGVTDVDHVPPTVTPGAPPIPPPKPDAAAPAPTKGDAAAAPAQRIVIVRLAHRSEALAPQGANVPLVAEAGEVRVTTERKGPVPIVFACFFYMH
ncbi:MAG: hypothetical protein ABR606_07815 [Vicinamibacterales bacterium]